MRFSLTPQAPSRLGRQQALVSPTRRYLLREEEAMTETLGELEVWATAGHLLSAQMRLGTIAECPGALEPRHLHASPARRTTAERADDVNMKA
ncbi:hypothetical protein NMY22_g3289 [Coprinellus aureogranulatus]|nr:hypothetical protein NMY22_g3289 [Coprinellus aureogranulatus]